MGSDRDGTIEIYVMDADGSNQTRLTSNPAIDMAPDWQPTFYEFSGFFSPVNNEPTLNKVKAGAAVPVKFSLDGDKGLDIFDTGYPRSRSIDCDTSVPIDGIEQTLTAGSSDLSYDAALDQYTYVWKTRKAWKGHCRQLELMLDDGTLHTASFAFK